MTTSMLRPYHPYQCLPNLNLLFSLFLFSMRFWMDKFINKPQKTPSLEITGVRSVVFGYSCFLFFFLNFVGTLKTIAIHHQFSQSPSVVKTRGLFYVFYVMSYPVGLLNKVVTYLFSTGETIFIN